MKIAYIAENLAGAEAHLMTLLGLDDPAKARARILKLLMQRLPVAFKRRDDFTILTMGVAFSRSYAALSTNPPTFDLELDDAVVSLAPKDHLEEVTFWIAPGL